MNPMVFMILKWEKELEHPDHHQRQWQTYARLLKTKEKKQPERKSTESVKTQKRRASTALGKYQTSTN
jgi:hypothetical protein